MAGSMGRLARSVRNVVAKPVSVPVPVPVNVAVAVSVAIAVPAPALALVPITRVDRVGNVPV